MSTSPPGSSDKPSAPVGDLIRRLLENARFLERKGWTKSAQLEREAAAKIEELAK